MTVFLHTADLHLNTQRKRYPQQYLKRGAWVLDELERLAVERGVACIVVAGDLFHQPNLTIAERQLLSDWLGRLKIPVLAISGNHDARAPRSIGDTCLSHLSSLQLHLHLVHDGDPKIVHAFGCCWLLLPYYKWTHQEFLLIVAAMVQRVRRKHADCPIVVVAHEAVKGATDDHGRPIENTRIRLLADLDVQYWALGDMHGPQTILPNAHYSGAPHQTNFGETPDAKGCLIVDTDDPEHPELVELRTPYPLVTAEAPLEEWPEFVRYVGPMPKDNLLPEHVLYEPPPRELAHVSTNAQVPLLHGLREHLEHQELSDELIERALQMANKIADDLGVETGETA